MRTILLYLLSLCFTAGLAYYGGRLQERKHLAASQPQAVAPARQRPVLPPSPRPPKTPEEPGPAEEPVAPPPFDAASLIADAASKLGAASVGQDGLLEAYMLVRQLAPDEIAAALTEIAKLPYGKARQSLTATVIARWAQVDGAAAMDFTLTKLDRANRPNAIAAALASWSDHDPAGALDWYHLKLSEGADFELAIGAKPAYLLPSIFQGLVASDIAEAYASFSKLTTDEEKNQALDGIASATLTGADTQRALDLAKSLDNAARSARLRIVSNWGVREPAAAAAWVSSVSDPTEKTQFAQAVGASWIAYDPAVAVPWMLENTSQLERPATIELATSIWVHSDPNATAEWLATLPKGPETDLGVSTLARNIVDIEPESALGWAKTISNEAMRRQTMMSVISQWRVREPERAVEAVNASGLSAEEIADYLNRTKPAARQ